MTLIFRYSEQSLSRSADSLPNSARCMTSQTQQGFRCHWGKLRRHSAPQRQRRHIQVFGVTACLQILQITCFIFKCTFPLVQQRVQMCWKLYAEVEHRTNLIKIVFVAILEHVRTYTFLHVHKHVKNAPSHRGGGSLNRPLLHRCTLAPTSVCPAPQ